MLKRVADAIRRKTHLARIPDIAGDVIRHGSVLWALDRRLRLVQEALGRVEARQVAQQTPASLRDSEYRVYSQWGEDGVIQYLLGRVPVRRKVFVEFGVEDYEEANTRFLLVNNNWSGLVIDGSAEHVAKIKASRTYWRHNLKAACAFVTRENINAILVENGLSGEIGLLSIDVDGMDYWVWEAIEAVTPAIVVVEYNHRLGAHDAVTVPYRPDFERRKAHHSLLYYGASLAALSGLGRRKGYALVGCGSAGLNAFFVHRDLKPPDLPERSAEEAFVAGQFREAHDQRGNRAEMTPEDEARLVKDLPLVRVAG